MDYGAISALDIQQGVVRPATLKRPNFIGQKKSCRDVLRQHAFNA